MNITVYCGSKTGNDPEFSRVAIELGEWIGKDGHSLVYGGSDVGLMGIVANTAMENGARAIGVFPNSLAGRENPHPSLSEMIIVDSIDDRKEKMMELGDVFIALPGGPGTLEEISQVISLARVEQLSGKCIVFNVDGYYDCLLSLFDDMESQEFISEYERNKVKFVNTMDELKRFLSE